MDDESRDDHWLDDRLRDLEGDGPGFTVVNSPLRPVVERGNPWKVDVRHHELKAFVEALRPVEDGRATLAVVTDVEEDPVARVQTAVLAAQRVREKGKSVLLVDADVRHVGLSRWLSDRELDAEGLVDVLQYGASVSAVRRPSPIEGVRILPIGSYRPDETGLFGEEDLLRLVNQLRAEADVVLLLAPAWITADRFHPVLVHADTVIVSLHLDRTLGPKLQDLLEYLQGLNIPVAGLMTYAGPDAAERRVDDVLSAKLPSGEVPVVTSEIVDELVDDEPRPARVDDVQRPSTTPEPQLTPGWPETKPRALEPPIEDDGRSSRVFRLAAVVAVVALVAFIGWWSLSSRDDTIDVPVRTTMVPPAGDTDDLITSEPEPVRVGTAAAGSTATEVTELEPLAEEPEPRRVEEPEAARPEEPLPTVEVADEDVALETPEITPPPSESPRPTVPSPRTTETWRTDVARPVGGGYALHVASLADSSVAETEAARMARARGWQPEVQGALVDGRRWYRVLVGRFDSRADALAAREPVGELLDLDWVGVVRVP